MLGNNVWRLWHEQRSQVFPRKMVRTNHERCTCIFPAHRVLVSVGSAGSRNLDNFSENICYMSRGREVMLGDSTSVGSLRGTLEKTALL